VTHIVGLDLGQSSDYTASCVLERSLRPDPDDERLLLSHYACRYIHRWPLKTPYDTIIEEVVRLVATPPLKYPKLAVDQTGVGAAVVDLIVKAQPAAWVRPILITAGHQVVFTDGAWHVPKKELVSTLQVLLQARRLKIAPIPERELLTKELLAFKVKITVSANETFEAWRERDHDDLVLAVALAAWLGEKESGTWEIQAIEPESTRGRAVHLRNTVTKAGGPYWLRASRRE
jgi:hypothetical protein